MAKAKKKKGLPKEAEKYKFEKGKSGNPKGRPPLTPVQRELKDLNLKIHAAVIKAVLTGTKQDLQDLLDDPEATALQLVLVKTVIRAIKEGDYSRIREIVQVIVGKIPDNVNLILSGQVNTTVDAQVAILKDEELRKRLDKIRNDI